MRNNLLRSPLSLVALDISYFEANGKSTDVDTWALPISPLLMLRYPLMTSEAFPTGRVQPYVGVGPAFALASISADLDGNGVREVDDEPADGVGLDVRAGLAWHVSKHLAPFTEYRFTQVDVESDFEPDFIFLGEVLQEVDTTLATHHVLGGVSFRF